MLVYRITSYNVCYTKLLRLIPGSRSRQPELECGATLFSFKDGIGATPYGYSLRTKEANLVGRVELDLRKETLQLEFSSSSRSGVGLSVGNVFRITSYNVCYTKLLR